MIKRLVVELNQDLHQRVKVKAVDTKKSMKQVVIDLLTEWVKKGKQYA